jgi:hypothetical protein
LEKTVTIKNPKTILSHLNPSEMASNNNDPASDASDALSLHTIAEQEDAYAAQEQEDADFALALLLEDEERQNLITAHRESELQPDTLPPYRDSDNVETLPPYRDDPDAIATDYEATMGPDTTEPLDRAGQDNLRVVRVVRRIGRKWFWCLAINFLVFILLIGTILLVLAVAPKVSKLSGKEVAFRDSGSRDYDLNLVKLYPALEGGAGEACKRTWNVHGRSIKCHEMILYSGWDDGEVKLEGADPFGYSEAVCTSSCRSSIDNLRYMRCYRRTDRFNITAYERSGNTYFEMHELDEEPNEVYNTLIHRYDRFCAKPPKNKPTPWGTCAADLWMTWGIVDGKNEANLNGLDQFRNQTKDKYYRKGGQRTGSITLLHGEKKDYNVTLPIQRIAFGETGCGYCTMDWLGRKMRSFEYGEIMNPKTGQAMSLEEFSTTLDLAMRTCRPSEYQEAIGRVLQKWTKLGWWCDDGICPQQPEINEDTRGILHGMRKDDWQLSDIRGQIDMIGTPKKALQTLHDELLHMPCSIWFDEAVDMKYVIPYAYVIEHLCRDPCRNAVDRIQQQHGMEFALAARAESGAHIFQNWDLARALHNKTCRSGRTRSAVCAPGYAALGHPEWTFTKTPPSMATILSTFSREIDTLDKNLPSRVVPPKKDEESQKLSLRIMEESVCNACAGELLIGRNPDHKSRIKEFCDNQGINGAEYIQVAKKYFRTCVRMAGMDMSWQQWDTVWGKIGLDRCD